MNAATCRAAQNRITATPGRTPSVCRLQSPPPAQPSARRDPSQLARTSARATAQGRLSAPAPLAHGQADRARPTSVLAAPPSPPTQLRPAAPPPCTSRTAPPRVARDPALEAQIGPEAGPPRRRRSPRTPQREPDRRRLPHTRESLPPRCTLSPTSGPQRGGAPPNHRAGGREALSPRRPLHQRRPTLSGDASRGDEVRWPGSGSVAPGI